VYPKGIHERTGTDDDAGEVSMSLQSPLASDHQLARMLQIGVVLEEVVEKLEAETIPFDEIQALVEQQYEAEQDFDGVLYDQLCNEETAYKFYDDLIGAIESSEAAFSVDRDRVLAVLREIRDEEEGGVEEVTQLMEAQE